MSSRLILSFCLVTFTCNLGCPHERKEAATKPQIKATNRPRNQAMKNRKDLMSVVHLNARSVASRENFHLLKDMVINNKYDVFTISELWLDSTVCNADILIPG